MSTLIMLVGIPGSGKSTYIETHLSNEFPNAILVSSDYFIEKFSRRLGKTYSEVFDYAIGMAIRLMHKRASRAIENNRDIIWDQTSTTIKSRRNKFKMIKRAEYKTIGIVFETPPHEILIKRLDSRVGKTIPGDVVQSMITNFQEPTIQEGFDEIYHVVSY